MTDTLDREIVAALCRDGRADAVEIAEMIDAIPTAVQKRLRALEAEGVIEGYTVRLDHDQLGYRTVIFRVATDHGAAPDITGRLRETSSIVTVYETSGEYNVFAVGKFADDAAIGTMLQKLHTDPAVCEVNLTPIRAVGTEGALGESR